MWTSNLIDCQEAYHAREPIKVHTTPQLTVKVNIDFTAFFQTKIDNVCNCYTKLVHLETLPTLERTDLVV